MRKVVSGLFISADGVVEGPDQWQFDVFDADMGEALAKHLTEVDAILLGRVTYQEWVQYWPNYEGGEDAGFADHINNTQKYVVSNTLESTEWQNSTLVKGSELAATIKELKQRPGKNISVTGSPTLVRSRSGRGLGVFKTYKPGPEQSLTAANRWRVCGRFR